MKQILIISSNPEITKNCSRVLENGSYEDIKLIDCSNARAEEQLIQILRNNPADIIIARGGKKSFIEKRFP